jgi:hypothetical protein
MVGWAGLCPATPSFSKKLPCLFQLKKTHPIFFPSKNKNYSMFFAPKTKYLIFQLNHFKGLS